MNKSAYTELVNENIEWLRMALIAYKEKYPDANRGKMEVEHIEQILLHSIETEYEQKIVYMPEGALQFVPQVHIACTTLLHDQRTSDSDVQFVEGVVSWGQRKGFLTGKQAQVLGRIYKNTINGGKIVPLDWWT